MSAVAEFGPFLQELEDSLDALRLRSYGVWLCIFLWGEGVSPVAMMDLCSYGVWLCIFCGGRESCLSR